MFALLNPRVIACLALAGFLAFTHFSAYRKGKQNERLVWEASVAAANEESRRLERARQSRADEAGKLASVREAAIRSASVRVASERDRLQHAISTANERGSQSLAACRQHTATLEAVFGECRGQLEEVGRAADGHASDSLKLQQSWPQ